MFSLLGEVVHPGDFIYFIIKRPSTMFLSLLYHIHGLMLGCNYSLFILPFQTKMAGEKNVWCRKYRNLIGTLDIRLKKIVLAGYRGNTSHVNFAKFFVLNARMLESMRLELCIAKPSPSNAWIDKQYRLLQTKNKASRDMQLDFASDYGLRLTCSFFRPEQVHDLSTADPFP